MKTKLTTQREYILNLDCNFKPEKASYSHTSAKLTFCHLTLSNSVGFTKEDSRYGNISVQKIGDPTSTSVRTLNLCSFQGVQYKLKYISAYKNLGYLKPFALGFMSLALFVFV